MEAAWTRAPGWVHRVGADKVMVAASGGRARELGGLAAAVWVALDRPATRREIAQRLDRAGYGGDLPSGSLDDALAQLLDADLVVTLGQTPRNGLP